MDLIIIRMLDLINYDVERAKHTLRPLSPKSTSTCYAFRVSSAPCAETYSPASASLYRKRIIYTDSRPYVIHLATQSSSLNLSMRQPKPMRY